MIPRADYHTHTFFSHGKGTPEENVCAAVKKGLKTIAISEHGPAHLTYGVKGEKLKALRREIDRLNRVYGRDIQVLMGIEANLYGDGRCELEFLDRLPQLAVSAPPPPPVEETAPQVEEIE